MFITDNQTVNDIGIFGKGAENSVFMIYNRVQTRGGAHVLEDMFRYPLNDAARINTRSGVIKYFAENRTVFPFEKDLFYVAEQYLNERDERTRLSSQQQSLSQKLSSLVATDTEYKNTVKGIVSIISILQQLQSFVVSGTIIACKEFDQERQQILQQLSESCFAPLFEGQHKGNYSHEQLAAYDTILRFRYHAEIKKLLQHIYYLDVYISVAKIANELGYAFANAIDPNEKEGTLLLLEDVKHPGVKNAKGNDTLIDSMQNIVFLTGANMAGKSTFMKSVGIAVYVAHIGLPIAAKSMRFTVMDGILSTINLPDNLGIGASHFYAEVLRVKKVASELSYGKRLFVLFDEMFRGTNVKDAGEATIAVVEGFTKKTNSLFMVSTHIIEAGDVLQKRSDRIRYWYLPTKMEGHKPVYSYILTEGITEDRHGMIIIRNEGILEMLERNQPKEEEGPGGHPFIV